MVTEVIFYKYFFHQLYFFNSKLPVPHTSCLVLKIEAHWLLGFSKECVPGRPALGPPRSPWAGGPRHRCWSRPQPLSAPLPQEQAQLYLRSGAVSSATFEQPSRQVKLWVKMVTPLIIIRRVTMCFVDGQSKLHLQKSRKNKGFLQCDQFSGSE